MKTLSVPLGQHAYDVIIETNALAHANDFITHPGKRAIITDSGVPSLYIEQLKKSLGIVHVLTFEQGESHKTMETVLTLIDQLQRAHFNRGDLLLAVGGGIVGDVTGLVAALYLRGIDFIQVPTTLLAQIDSSIGGKVGVNTVHAKNSIGVFKQPLKVLIDPSTLNTLSERQITSGMAELIKHALIRDEALYHDLATRNVAEAYEEFIYRSLVIKKDIVIRDVEDRNERQLLNFGHTIGHALERYSNYELTHGEAIAIGMIQITKEPHLKKAIQALLTRYHLPSSYPYSKKDLLEFILQDKKIKHQSITIVTLKKIGKAELTSIPLDDLATLL